MNWYNKIKLAFPLQNTDPLHSKYDQFEGYFSIGHRPNFERTMNSSLWFVTPDFHISKTQDEPRHEAWPDFINSEYVASGRCDNNKGICSLALNPNYITPMNKEKVLKRVEKLLDKTFNYPTIKMF